MKYEKAEMEIINFTEEDQFAVVVALSASDGGSCSPETGWTGYY